MKNKKSFTLVEIVVVIAIFGAMFAAGGMSMTTLMRSWKKQKDAVAVVRDIRWAIDTIAEDVREGENLTTDGSSWICFDKDVNSDGFGDSVIYFFPNGVAGFEDFDRAILRGIWWGVAADIGVALNTPATITWLLTSAWAPAWTQIGPNYVETVTFTDDGNGLMDVELDILAPGTNPAVITPLRISTSVRARRM